MENPESTLPTLPEPESAAQPKIFADLPAREPLPPLIFPEYMTSPVPQRRRTALISMGLAALAFLAWFVMNREGLIGGAGPSQVVRAQIDDLGRGQLRAAYELFSPRYRQEVPFVEWRALVLTHWRVFRTRELRSGDNEESGGRAVLEMHMVAESGDHYVARFTLIRADGRWWIDDLRWSEEPEERGRIST